MTNTVSNKTQNLNRVNRVMDSLWVCWTCRWCLASCRHDCGCCCRECPTSTSDWQSQRQCPANSRHSAPRSSHHRPTTHDHEHATSPAPPALSASPVSQQHIHLYTTITTDGRPGVFTVKSYGVKPSERLICPSQYALLLENFWNKTFRSVDFGHFDSYQLLADD